jgi:hypothetical protein
MIKRWKASKALFSDLLKNLADTGLIRRLKVT